MQVLGREHLTREPGRGLLLLVPHTPLTFLLEQEPEIAAALVVRTRDTGPARRAALYRESQEILQRGGAVVVLPDEFTGSGGLPVSVAGRRRLLRWGFGRLIEDTGAVGLPWFPGSGSGWDFTSTFSTPLTPAAPDVMLANYAQLLDTFWRNDLGLVEWHMLRRHLTLSEPAAVA